MKMLYDKMMNLIKRCEVAMFTDKQSDELRDKFGRLMLRLVMVSKLAKEYCDEEKSINEEIAKIIDECMKQGEKENESE